MQISMVIVVKLVHNCVDYSQVARFSTEGCAVDVTAHGAISVN